MMSELAGTFFADRASMVGKVAVVTGAGSGIGLELARRCALTFGMTVVMGDVDAEALAREAARLGPAAVPVVADVRRRADSLRLLEAARRASSSGRVDCAFLNAGVAGAGAGVSVLRGSEADWRWLLDVNLFGLLHGLQVFGPAMAAQGGAPGLLAVTASDRGLDVGGLPGCTAAYATSKHGAVAMCEALEGELTTAGLGGRVQLSVLCAGLVNSNLWAHDRAEAQRDAADRSGVQAKKSQRMIFESMGTSVADTVDTFFEGVVRGQFICDSVPGQAQETFARRAAYIMEGRMPSDARMKWSKL